MGRRRLIASAGALLLAGTFLRGVPARSATPSCDYTVSYGHTVSVHGTTTASFTVCTGAPAPSLLDVRVKPTDRTASLHLELDLADGTYLRSSATGAPGVTQRVALANPREQRYEVSVDAGLLSAERFKGATFTACGVNGENPMWSVPAECAFPSATQNEISEKDAITMLSNGVFVVSEGANMPTTAEGVQRFLDAAILYGPGKAANAGGVAVSGLEMSQDAQRMMWPREEVDRKLKDIMRAIHQRCVEAATEYGTPGNYVNGANIGGFVKVADAMLDEGIV